MADYGKVEVEVTYSPNTDFTSPHWKQTFPRNTIRPCEGEIHLIQTAGGGGVTLALGNYTTIDLMIVQNEDPTNNVTATWTDEDSDAGKNEVIIQPGRMLMVPRVKTPGDNLVLVALAGAPICRVIIMGS